MTRNPMFDDGIPEMRATDATGFSDPLEGPGPTVGSPWLTVLICLALVVTTFAAFGPTFDNDFINWDDPPNLIENPHVRGLTAENVKWMFTDWPNSHLGHYQPLTWLTFAVDYELYGEISARGIHLTNLVLHCVNAVLFYLLTLRLLRRCVRFDDGQLQWGAAFAAIVFALHPMRVESVAWATERRDLLSGMFFILALLAYLRSYTPSHKMRWSWWALSALLHACACLSKVICVTLLAVIVAMDFYPLRRLGGRRRWWGSGFNSVWAQKIPFFLVSLVASVMAPLAQGAAMRPLADLTLDLRIANSFYALAFYIYKLFLPFHLIPIYELPRNVTPLAWFYAVSAVVVVALTFVLVSARRRVPAVLAVWLTYIATLSPVLSITQNGAQFAADRYAYVSCLGFAALVGAGLSWVLHRFRKRKGALVIITVLAVGVSATWGALTWRQTKLWHDSVTLWNAALAVDPGSWVANRNLADALMEKDEPERAAEHYRRSMAVEKRDPSLYANAAIAFSKLGLLDEADDCAATAMRLAPMNKAGLLNAGYVKQKKKEWDAAIRLYRQGLQYHPQDVAFHVNLGVSLARDGDHAGAVEAFQGGLAITPDDPKLMLACARSLAELDRLTEAEDMARQVLRLKPNSRPAAKLLERLHVRALQVEAAAMVPELERGVAARPDDPTAHVRLADALAQAARAEQAAHHYERALHIEPANADARVKLARCWSALNRESDAINLLREGLSVVTDDPRVPIALIRILATSPDAGARNGTEAVRLAERLLRSAADPTPQMLGMLAAAYAEAGRFDDAVEACERALQKAEQLGRKKAAQLHRERLELYRARKPYHQPRPGAGN